MAYTNRIALGQLCGLPAVHTPESYQLKLNGSPLVSAWTEASVQVTLKYLMLALTIFHRSAASVMVVGGMATGMVLWARIVLASPEAAVLSAALTFASVV